MSSACAYPRLIIDNIALVVLSCIVYGRWYGIRHQKYVNVCNSYFYVLFLSYCYSEITGTMRRVAAQVPQIYGCAGPLCVWSTLVNTCVSILSGAISRRSYVRPGVDNIDQLIRN